MTRTTWRARAKLIDMKRAQDFGAGNPVKGGTIYLTTADENGMMVSFIQSNYMGFGSGCVEPTFGISLQNRGHGFSLDAARRQPGQSGRAGQAAVPHHHPGLPHERRPARDELRRDGRQHAAPGPHADAGAHAGLRAEPAGRLRCAALALQRGLEINVESALDAQTVQGLAERGHRMEVINDSYQDFGAGQFIWRAGDPKVEGYVAASDARRDGQAVGF
jgi:gamma-glutamyltranspeptidase/glutathione hydrolase